MTRSLLARLFLVVALLAGWQAALVHPLEHVDEHGHLVHAGEGHAHDDDSSSDPTAQLCDALGALTAFAAQDAGTFSFDVSSVPACARPFRGLRAADAVPFLSQGPPALL